MSKPKITAEWMDKDDDKQIQSVQEGPFKKKVITTSDVINSKQMASKEKPKEKTAERQPIKEATSSKACESHIIIKENDQ